MSINYVIIAGVFKESVAGWWNSVQLVATFVPYTRILSWDRDITLRTEYNSLSFSTVKSGRRVWFYGAQFMMCCKKNKIEIYLPSRIQRLSVTLWRQDTCQYELSPKVRCVGRIDCESSCDAIPSPRLGSCIPSAATRLGNYLATLPYKSLPLCQH